jgi:hypothetical protein
MAAARLISRERSPRRYEPALGRFVTSDGYPGSLSVPSSLNLYAYVIGNPTNLVDPDGNCPWCVAAVIGGAIGGSASLLGYLAVSGSSRNLQDALVAFGGGAVSGAVCAGTVFLACAGATTLASVAQYGFSTGPKSPQGYVLAGGFGLIFAPFVFTPYKVPSSGISRWVFNATRPGPLVRWEERASVAALSSFLRSLLTSAVGGAITQTFGAENK